MNRKTKKMNRKTFIKQIGACMGLPLLIPLLGIPRMSSKISNRVISRSDLEILKKAESESVAYGIRLKVGGTEKSLPGYFNPEILAKLYCKYGNQRYSFAEFLKEIVINS